MTRPSFKHSIVLLAVMAIAGCDSQSGALDGSLTGIPAAKDGQGILTISNVSSSELTQVYFGSCSGGSLPGHLTSSIPSYSSRAWYADAGCYAVRTAWGDKGSRQYLVNLPDRGGATVQFRDADRLP